MSTSVAPFRRPFSDGDPQLFNRLIGGLLHTPCVRVARLYGDAISFHFGQLVPNRRRGSAERGQWIITAWGCDIAGSDSSGTFDSRVEDDDSVLARVAAADGQHITGIVVDPETLSLHLSFSGGLTIRLLTDPDIDADIWMISLPTQQTVAAKANRVWLLEDD